MTRYGRAGFVSSTPHVWHQGRKVTGRAPARDHPYYDWRRRCYVYPQHKPKTWPVGTIANSARPTATLAHARGSFRLVDRHGKATGRRYTRLGPNECGMYLVVDQHGAEDWLDGSARVRVVDQQAETVHSQASRIINRLHRQLKAERSLP